MRFKQLFWKVFLSAAILTAVAFASVWLLAGHWQREHLLAAAKQRLDDVAMFVAANFAGDSAEDFAGDSQEPQKSRWQDLATQTGLQISVLDSQQHVVFDSAGTKVGSDFADLLEFRRIDPESEDPTATAQRGGFYYLAREVREDDGSQGYVRVAIELTTIGQRVSDFNQRLGWALLVAWLLINTGLFLTFYRITAPLSQLAASVRNMSQRGRPVNVLVQTNDEIGALASAFNNVQTELDRRVRQVSEEGQQRDIVLASMREGVIAVDQNERIILANQASRRMLEFVTGDWVGRQLLEVTRHRALHDAVSQALLQDQPQTQEIEIPGQPRLTISLHLSRLPGNPCPGVVAVLHDITELRRLEKLRQELVQNVSHELKTPLASIKAYAETLSLGAVNDPEINMSFVSRIEQQADRLHQLIIDMLQIARVEAGKEQFEIEEVPLCELAASCFERFHHDAEIKQIQFELDVPDEPVVVSADAEGIRKIMDNLVHNAVKYSPNGRRVTVKVWESSSGMAVFSVTDTGNGISKKDQARIFERFYRVDAARNQDQGGTGLGLAIVKHLAMAFGGNVSVESEVGVGSTFTLQLPVAVKNTLPS